MSDQPDPNELRHTAEGLDADDPNSIREAADQLEAAAERIERLEAYVPEAELCRDPIHGDSND